MKSIPTLPRGWADYISSDDEEKHIIYDSGRIECNVGVHKWKDYVGILEAYQYCEYCGIKYDDWKGES